MAKKGCPCCMDADDGHSIIEVVDPKAIYHLLCEKHLDEFMEFFGEAFHEGMKKRNTLG